MNPTQTNTQGIKIRNPFDNLEGLNEIEKSDPENNLVNHSKENKQSITQNWETFYNLRSEASESKIEGLNSSIPEFSPSKEGLLKPDLPLSIIENTQESIFEEAGIKLDFPLLGKEIGQALFGALGLFKEIFLDTLVLVVGKKDKKGQKPETDPEKAKAKAEKKAENQRKQNNIRAFFEGLRAQTSNPATVEGARIDNQEKANINLTAKIGQESYTGIKDSFGKITIYAQSLIEKAYIDQDKKAKKQEKEMKIASINTGPDLNLDKVAEGGFLSSTGGQGAG